MSQENVDIVRRVYDAVQTSDSATVFALYDPEVEWDWSRHPISSMIGGSVYRGHEGLRDFFRDLREVWEETEWSVKEMLDGGDHVVVLVDQRTRGRTSGVQVIASAVSVWTVQAGRIVRVVWF